MQGWRKQEDGFTLVEMIITIAISAILVGSVAGAMGYISAGNSKRSAARFNSKLNTAQTETMMKKDPTILYLYEDTDGIKAGVSSTDCSTYAELQTAITAGKVSSTVVGGARVSVQAKDDSGATYNLSSGNMIKIAFEKSTGAYKCANSGTTGDTRFFSEITFNGAESYKVTLVKQTGKHVLNK